MGAMSFVSEDILCHVNMDLTLLEVHNLAYFSDWSREECWNTPCTERGVFNDMIKQQIKAESGGNNSGTPNKPKYEESR